MEIAAQQIFAVCFTLINLSMTAGAPTRTVLQLTSLPLQHDARLSLDKRPKYMDTRRDMDIFKDLVLLSIQKLVDEGRLNPHIVLDDDSTEPIEKRERYMGICMRKQYNNFIPFPCLRSGR